MKHQEDWTKKVFEELSAQALERSLEVYPYGGGKIVIDGQTYLNFSSNDYLGLAHDKDIMTVARQAIDSAGTGSSASRLVTGTISLHDELEKCLAEFIGQESALIFGAGYLANLGVISATVGRNDFVVADRLVHASIIDGMTLSRAQIIRYKHNDIESLEQSLHSAHVKRKRNNKVLIVTESVFSMDGDLAPLKEIAALADQYEAMLMVDEAHAIGVFGPRGSGRVAHCRLQDFVNIGVGTFSKALGSYGGFVTCSNDIKKFLINRARSFIYNTALPPAQVGAALEAIRILKRRETLGITLLQRSNELRRKFLVAGLDTLKTQSHIIPVVVGDNIKAIRLSKTLRTKGIIAVAIREPTVPKGTARLRFSLSLAHTEEDLERAADIVIACAQEEHLI